MAETSKIGHVLRFGVPQSEISRSRFILNYFSGSCPFLTLEGLRTIWVSSGYLLDKDDFILQKSAQNDYITMGHGMHSIYDG